MSMKRTSVASFFIRCTCDSMVADRLFSSSPMYESVPVKILQIMKLSKGWIVAEVIYE